MAQLAGIFPAIFTPMDENGAVDPPMLCKLVDRLFDAGVHGLYACGSTGEGLLLSAEERERTLESILEATAGRGAVMVHVGAVATQDSVRLARHAEEVGADAVSSVPPFAFGRSPEGIDVHYRAIADACALPLYLYNIPSLTGVRMTADDFERLLDVPTVRGAKFSDLNLSEEYRAITLSDRFDIFHGADDLLLYGLMMGAVGGIGMTYNFMPKLYVAIYDRFQQGDLRQANDLQHEAARFVKIRLRHCGANSVGLGKMLMRRLGIECGRARLPNPPLAKGVFERFIEDLERAEFFSKHA